MVFGLFGKKGSKKASKHKKSHKTAPKHKPSKPVHKAVKVVKKAVAPMPKMSAEQGRMDDIKSFEMLKQARLPVAPYFVVKSEKELPEAMKKVGTPCIMTVKGTKIQNATQVGGEMRHVMPEEAASIFNKLMKIKGAEKVLVQKHINIENGIGFIVGAKAEPQFGYIVSIGIGGDLANVLKDVTFRVVPLDLTQAQTMVKELKIFEMLENKHVKLEALYELLMRIGKFAAENKFKEVSLNPVFCNPEGCWIASAKILK